MLRAAAAAYWAGRKGSRIGPGGVVRDALRGLLRMCVRQGTDFGHREAVIACTLGPQDYRRYTSCSCINVDTVERVQCLVVIAHCHCSEQRNLLLAHLRRAHHGC